MSEIISSMHALYHEKKGERERGGDTSDSYLLQRRQLLLELLDLGLVVAVCGCA